VDMKRRLEAIDALRSRHPAVAWRLLLALLPEPMGSSLGTHPPSYRDWKAPDQPVTNRDYLAMIRAIAERVSADVGQDVDRWMEIIPKLDDLPPDLRKTLLEMLASLAPSSTLSEADRGRIFETLDELVNRHREFAGEANWALPEPEVAAMM